VLFKELHGMSSTCGKKQAAPTQGYFFEPMIPDSFVIVGQSSSGGNYKEHIVPRVVICAQCHALFENGASINEVASFIRKYLKIVLISKEERDRLDKKENLNLKQRMPDGWSFDCGSEFARLHAAGISYVLFSEKT